MYILLENSRPFAIVETPANKKIKIAIAEKFSHKHIILILGKFSLPHWGETIPIYYEGVDLDELEYVNVEIQIMKLVKY